MEGCTSVKEKHRKRMAPAFCIEELWRKVLSSLFRLETDVLCSPYNVIWLYPVQLRKKPHKFTTRMNIHLGTKWTEKDGLWKRKDIALSNSIWNYFQIYSITLLSEGCTPYSTNSGVRTMRCRVTMETTVSFNRRLNDWFYMLKVAIASNVTAWRILESCIFKQVSILQQTSRVYQLSVI